MTWGNIVRAAWIALFATLVALAVAKLNFLGLEASSGQRADDVAQRLGIVGYRYSDHETPRPGQDWVRVIHIDDEALTALRPDWQGWPPGYENLAVMIEDLARAPRIQPARGVFVDLEITGENLTPANQSEFDSLVQTLGALTGALDADGPGWGTVEGCRHDPLTTLACMIEWDGVPIILASGEASPLLDANPGSPRGRLGQVALLAPTLVDSRSYPLVRAAIPDEEERQPRPSDAYDLYPAAALYAVDCLVRARAVQKDFCGVPAIEMARQAAATLRQDRDSRPAMPRWSEVHVSWRQPEAVIWSSDQSPRQLALWRQTSTGTMPKCEPRPPLWKRLLQTEPAVGDEQACRYTLSLGYDRIVAGLGLSREIDYPDLLGDKLVLIGVHFRSNDWTPTPLHGALPGVQYHAMALDNLLEFGRNYRRDEGQGLGWGDLFSSILTFLTLFAINLASIEKRRITGARGALKPRWAIAWYTGLAAIMLSGLAIYMWATEFLWRSVMINWIGILATGSAAIWFTARNDISGDMAEWMNGSRPGRAVVAAFSAFDRSLRHPTHSPPQEKP